MTELINRDFLLNVGGLGIRARTEQGRSRPTLKAAFRVERSVQENLNTAEVSIYNLNSDSRARLQKSETLPTTIEAGYIDNISLIFAGDLEFGANVRNETDWITSLQARDGGNASEKRVSDSFKKVRIGAVLERLVGELGVGLGNTLKKSLAGPQRGRATEYAKGYVIQGSVMDEIKTISRQMGLQFSIQNGIAQFLEPDETLKGKIVVLSEISGLIGSPEPGDKGIVNARSLLQPNLVPGLQVEMQSQQVQGLFRIERAIYIGDTWGDDWYTDLELKPVKRTSA